MQLPSFFLLTFCRYTSWSCNCQAESSYMGITGTMATDIICPRNYFPSVLIESAQSRGEGNFPSVAGHWIWLRSLLCCFHDVDTCQPRFRELVRSGWRLLPIQHRNADGQLWLAVVPQLLPTQSSSLVWTILHHSLGLLHCIGVNHLSPLESQNVLVNKFHSLWKTSGSF